MINSTDKVREFESKRIQLRGKVLVEKLKEGRLIIKNKFQGKTKNRAERRCPGFTAKNNVKQRGLSERRMDIDLKMTANAQFFVLT